jgi:hypothetical protein
VDPKLLADLACTLLIGRAGEQPRQGDGYGRQRVTLKGIVGRELTARGLQVGLEVTKDPMFFEAQTAIVVTRPGSGQNAEVRVTDDGYLTWERNYWDEAAATTGEPEHATQITSPKELAADIVATISMAMSLILAGQPSQQRSHTPARSLLTSLPRLHRVIRCGWRRA